MKPEPAREPWHYYEAHVTLDPVFDKRLEVFKAFCEGEKFRVADLLLKKSKAGEAVAHTGDSFCTSRGTDYQELEDRMFSLIEVLIDHGYKVRRYKIESTLLDSRYNDTRFKLETPKSSGPRKSDLGHDGYTG
jgi:hypothetical protein